MLLFSKEHQRKIFVLLLTVITFSFFAPRAQALSFPVGHFNVSVNATIGEYYISLSGFIAPYASIVLTTDNLVMRSVTADANGYFYISDVLVKAGFNHFCFTAVDVKRLGESQACFTIPPVMANYTRTNIFLPPTIGLFRTQITAGSNAIIWGYSMPGATVTIHASNGKTYTAIADKTGFYQITANIASAGTYDLSATAVLKGQNSEKPTNKVTLIALTLAQSTSQTVGNWFLNLLKKLFGLPLGPLWFVLPILILIFILWRKLQGLPLLPTFGKGTSTFFYFDYLFHRRKLHHWWMEGVGY